MASRLLAAEEALPELLPAASACRLAAARREALAAKPKGFILLRCSVLPPLLGMTAH
jgi:hypothetical protein